MGFTIDMVSGNISNITNGIDSVKSEDVSSTKPSVDRFDPSLQERLLPVSDTFEVAETYTIPSSLIDQDIDLFIDKVAR